jgi:hypothetical protein
MGKFEKVLEGVIDPSLRHKNVDLDKTFVELVKRVENYISSINKRSLSRQKQFSAESDDSTKRHLITQMENVSAALDRASKL